MDWSRRTLLAASFAGVAGTATANPFADKQWERRLFLIFAPSEDHEGFKNMRSQTRTANFGRRDLDLVEVTGRDVRINREPVETPTADELRRYYRVAGRQFAIRLVGKDGTVKLSRNSGVPITEVYDLIDSMPMRQQEMQQRGAGG